MSLNAITHSRSAEQHNAWSWVDQSLRHVLASCTQSAYWEQVTQCHCTHTHTLSVLGISTPLLPLQPSCTPHCHASWTPPAQGSTKEVGLLENTSPNVLNTRKDVHNTVLNI